MRLTDTTRRVGNRLPRQVIRDIQPFPFGKDTVILPVIITLIPVAPLVLTMIPLEELIMKLLGAVF